MKHTERDLRLMSALALILGPVLGIWYIAKFGTIELPEFAGLELQARKFSNAVAWAVGFSLIGAGLFWAVVLLKMAVILETGKDNQARLDRLLELHSVRPVPAGGPSPAAATAPAPAPESAPPARSPEAESELVSAVAGRPPALSRDQLLAKLRADRQERERRERALELQHREGAP